MVQDLSNSIIARKNILNNQYALIQLEKHLGLGGLSFNGETVFVKLEVANLLLVDERTIDRYLHDFQGELIENGYKVLTGQALKNLRSEYVNDRNVVDISSKAPSIGIFTFRALLNLSMLITESDVAKVIRSRILDIVLDVVTEKAGGHTKYINQRSADYLPAAFQETNYRQEFTNALDEYLDMGNIKYAIYTNKIYQAVFREDAAEYRKILKLSSKDRVRETMYAEILNVIASFENGLANEMKMESQKLKRKLRQTELNQLINNAEHNPYLKPIIEEARIKMASRDLGFRAAQHHKLKEYIKEIPADDFDRFLGKESQSLEEQFSNPELLAVFKRLKDR